AVPASPYRLYRTALPLSRRAQPQAGAERRTRPYRAGRRMPRGHVGLPVSLQPGPAARRLSARRVVPAARPRRCRPLRRDRHRPEPARPRPHRPPRRANRRQFFHRRTEMNLKSLLIATVFAALPGLALAQSTTYPLTIQNGDNVLVFEQAPERAVTLNGHVTELMLSLGLAPKMVGTAYLNHPILESLEAESAAIPILSDGTGSPSLEVVLNTGADFAFGRLSAFRDTAVAPIEKLKELGVDAYAVKGTLIKGATMA